MRSRTLATLVIAFTVPLLAGPAWADDKAWRPEFDFYVPPPPPPEASVTLQLLLGGGYDTSVQGGQTGAAAAGIELLVRYGMFLGGAFVDVTMADGQESTAYVDPQNPGYGGHQSAFWGLAAGVAWEPLPWARLQLLAQGGIHEVVVDSNFVADPGSAQLPFVGLKAGAAAFTGDLGRPPALLGARRVGAVLQADLRADLGHDVVRPGVPPGTASLPEVQVGGVSLVVTLGMAMEW